MSSALRDRHVETACAPVFTRHLFIVFLFAVIALPGYGQGFTNKTIPDLQKKLAASKPDTARMNIQLDLALLYVIRAGTLPQDVDSAVYWINQAVALNRQLGHPMDLAIDFMQGRRMQEQGKFDSAKIVLLRVAEGYKKEGNIKLQANTILNLANWLPISGNRGEPSEKVAYFKEAAKLYNTFLPLRARQIQVSIADVYSTRGENDKAKALMDSVLQANAGSSYPEVIPIHLLLAKINNDWGYPNIALGHVQNAMKEMEQQRDTTYQFLVYWHLSTMYATLENHAEASQWYGKLLGYIKKVYPGFVYMELPGHIHSLIAQGRAKDGIALIEELLQEFPRGEESWEDRYKIAISLANCYAALGEHAQAQKYYEQFLTYESKGRLPPVYFNDLGMFYLRTKQYSESRKHLQKSLRLSVEVADIIERARTYKVLSALDSATGNYYGAYINLQKHKILHDSIFSARRTAQFNELRIKNETEKKEESIKHLSSQNAMNLARLEQASLIQILALSGITLLLVIVGLLYNQFRIKKKSHKQLQISQQDVINKNSVLQSMISEKEWLLKEVHHRVKNNLQTVVSLLESQAAFIENDEALFAIQESQNRIHTMSLIHQKLYLDESRASLDMAIYLRELVQYLRESYNHPEINFSLTLQDIELDVSQAIPVGLILNEAITNSVKYAFPVKTPEDEIVITMTEVDGEVLLTFTDNGIGLPAGFDFQGGQGGLGLKLIHGLTGDLDGQIRIESASGVFMRIAFVANTPLHRIGESQSMQA